jgi:glyoxylase-like metal-dependent hydrolase (beta-lactamase superfamily II)
VIVGDLEIHFVSDGQVRMEHQRPFGLVLREKLEAYLEPDEADTVPLGLNCLLVKSQGMTLLIDNGLGDKLSEKDIRRWHLTRPAGGLLTGLARLGIEPEDIDIVINTHLHDDHCGGNTRKDSDLTVAAFPNATYLVQRIEWAEASHPDSRTKSTYFPENYAPLYAAGRLRLLHGDTKITDEVSCVVTRGHTRGHQSVLLKSGDWSGLFVSDMATYTVHMTRATWVTAFDVEPLETIKTKEHWQRWALENNTWLFFYHETQTPVVRLVKRADRLVAEPIDEAQVLSTRLSPKNGCS